MQWLKFIDDFVNICHNLGVDKFSGNFFLDFPFYVKTYNPENKSKLMRLGGLKFYNMVNIPNYKLVINS